MSCIEREHEQVEADGIHCRHCGTLLRGLPRERHEEYERQISKLDEEIAGLEARNAHKKSKTSKKRSK